MNRFKPICNNGVYPDRPEDAIREELQWYKDHGYGGFAVNGSGSVKDVRDWLPGYMESVKKYCRIAKELDLDMWLFDEWGFPSGCACGLVLTPETRAKKLQLTYDRLLEAGEEVRLPVPPRMLSAGAIPVNRFAPYHPAGEAVLLEPEDGFIVFRATERTRLCVVTWEYHSFVTHVLKQYEEGDPTIGTIDILDAAAVRKFLDNMHERYVPVIGDEFGKTVKGFFYDEPEICWDFPYTPALDAYFEARHGYPMKTILPTLLAYAPSNCGVTDGASRGRLNRMFDDYTDSWTSLLAESFYGQIEEWCHAHGLESVGHQDLDHLPATLTTVSGDFYRNSLRNDRPGVDVIFHQIAPDIFADFPRFAGSVAHLSGKTGAMSETFALMGDALPPDYMRWDMEQQILRGIDTFFLYTHYVPGYSDPHVERHCRAVMERVGETASLLRGSRATVALLVPTREIAFERSCLNPHMVNGTPLSWDRVTDIAKALCYAPIDFEYVFEEGTDGLYEKGFRYLIVCGSSAGPAWSAIRDFIDKGGFVLNVYRSSVPDAPFVYLPKEAMKYLPREISFASGGGKIALRSCVTDDGPLYALLNESDDPFDSDVSFPAGIWSEKTADGWRVTDTAHMTFASRELKLLRPAKDGDLPALTVAQTIVPTEWTFTRKGFEPIRLAELKSWEEIDPALRSYTGIGVYEAGFDWPGGTARVKLGKVGFTAVVTVGGQTRDLPFSPYTCTFDLPAGRHTLRVEVMNSYANALYAGQEVVTNHEELLFESGLLGPVVIEQMK